MMRKSVGVVVGVVVAGALLFSGCSSSSSSSTSTTVKSKSPASTVDGILALGRPVVLSHAAGEDVAPHSSMFGYGQSVRDGVDILDLDIQRTKDGVLVVQHDDTTKRTTESDFKVADLTYAQIHELDNGYWFKSCANTCTGKPESDYIYRGVRTGKVAPPAGYNADDFAVPKFVDVANRWPDYVLNVEIKGRGADAFITAELLAKEIASLNRADSVVVTSFDDTVVEKFHSLAPTVAISPGLDALTAYVLAGTPIPMWGKILQVPPVYEGVVVFTPDYVKKTKAAGYINWIWPNGENENEAGYLKLFQEGADGINANNPPAAIAALKQYTTK
ncbi:MAG: glycerophosphodiester phosphodiesterase family protein [Acidimicrobiales bacterium]